MTYTKLIERLYNSHDAETLCADAALVIEALIAERDALQAENAGLRSECADLNQRWAEWKDSLDSVMKQRNALQARLDAMGKGEALAPLTNNQVLEGCKAIGIADSIGFIEAFELGVKYAERKHGIHAKGGQQ
jgi:hypothetical protein